MFDYSFEMNCQLMKPVLTLSKLQNAAFLTNLLHQPSTGHNELQIALGFLCFLEHSQNSNWTKKLLSSISGRCGYSAHTHELTFLADMSDQQRLVNVDVDISYLPRLFRFQSGSQKS